MRNIMSMHVIFLAGQNNRIQLCETKILLVQNCIPHAITTPNPYRIEVQTGSSNQAMAA